MGDTEQRLRQAGLDARLAAFCASRDAVAIDALVIDRLVRTNWLRTAAWTLTFLFSLVLRSPRGAVE